MPQEMHVLRCYNCEIFQVHIVKKVPKWECKVCGEKQSVKKVYSRGSGKDCRLHVQELNRVRLEQQGQELPQCHDDVNPQPVPAPSQSETSGWVEFLPSSAQEELDAEVEDSECSDYTFERPSKKRKRDERNLGLPKQLNDDNKENQKSVSVDSAAYDDVKDNSENDNCDVPVKGGLENQYSVGDFNTNTCSVKSKTKTSKWEEYIEVSSPVNVIASPELCDSLKLDDIKFNNNKILESLNREPKSTAEYKSTNVLFSSQESNLDSVLDF